jgi:glycosyltransferase involved in cell wall biosynthesis
MLFSIIIPVYNVAPYLRKAIDSVLCQSFQGEYEVVLINDGSTDGSGKICDEYVQCASIAHRIRVFHKPNGGVSSARNVGLKEARGEWVLFVDADDWIEPDYIGNFIRADFPVSDVLRFQGHKKYSSVTTTSSSASANFREFPLTPYPTTSEVVFRNNLLFYWGVWGKMFNRSTINKLNLRFDENLALGEDSVFFFKYLAGVASLDIVSGTAYCYRESTENSLSKSQRTWEKNTRGSEIIRDVAEAQVKRFAADCLVYRRRFLNMLNFEQFALRLGFLYAESLLPEERVALLKKTFGNKKKLFLLAEPFFANSKSYILLWFLFLLLPMKLLDKILASKFKSYGRRERTEKN